MADWRRIRFHYEVLGSTEDDLLREHQVSPALLKNAITTEGWVRQPTAKALVEWRDTEDPSMVADDVRKKAQILNTLRAVELLPMYIRVEEAILSQSLTMVRELEREDGYTAARTLKMLTDIITSMRPPMVDKAAEEARDKGLTINVIGGYGANASDDTTLDVEYEVCVDTPQLPS